MSILVDCGKLTGGARGEAQKSGSSGAGFFLVRGIDISGADSL